MPMLGLRSVTTLKRSSSGMPAKACATLAQPMRSRPGSRVEAACRRARYASREGRLRSAMRAVMSETLEWRAMVELLVWRVTDEIEIGWAAAGSQAAGQGLNVTLLLT